MNTEEIGYWFCVETYRASGRPSREWVTYGSRPDLPDENGDIPYPFNGMGGAVVGGPFASEEEAWKFEEEVITTDDEGYVVWRH